MQRRDVVAVARLEADVQLDQFGDHSVQTALARAEEERLLLIIPTLQPLASDVNFYCANRTRWS